MATIGTIRYRNGSNWVDILHPVGSFYFSTASTTLASLFGGTWVQITGAVIRGNNSLGYGGSDTHTMTESEMPSHRHKITTGEWSTAGSSYVPVYAGRTANGVNYTVYTGGGAAFTELPRYYNCYVWYRTA